jgi:hypothetical protein
VGRLRARGARLASGLGAAALLLTATASRAQEWYDSYERGEQALAKKQASRAIEQFERAIRKRPEPGTNVLTYGTNRLATYHPYLRLAQAQLLAGNPAGAREALQQSQARGREPAAERARLLAEADALERARAATAAPPPVSLPAPAAAPVLPVPTPPPMAVPAAPAAAPTTPAPAPAATPTPVAVTAVTTKVALAGALDVRSDPPGATVLLDGRLLGVTPLRVDVPPGEYTLTLRKESTADQTFPVRVVAGRTTSETRPLIAAAAPTPIPAATPQPLASLVVYSDPPGATVYVDDEPIGLTDPFSGRLVKSGVAPGPHRVRVAVAGRPEAAADTLVGASGPTTVRLVLPQAASGLPWPLLVGAAGLVVVVGGVLAWRRRSGGEASRTLTAPTRVAHRPPSGTGPRPTLTSDPTQLTPPPTVAAPATAVDATSADIETRALPTPPRTPTVGERFGEYLLLEPLGKGGMAHVFRAERGGEHFALKRPLPSVLDEPEFRERFLREAEIGRTLHHPNIIRIFERGDVAGVPYFTMELVKGETLQARLRRTGALRPRDAARLVAQVAEALDYAHLKGVIHRDLKPSNIMVLEDGMVKVMDYGIARARRFDGLTVTGAFLGTPDYVAPETAEGKGVDARSDLYSLGVVFYEMLTARKPFIGDTPFATIRKHCSEPPTPPSQFTIGLPPVVEAIVLRLLAKKPEDRFPGAEELLIALRDFINRAA